MTIEISKTIKRVSNAVDSMDHKDITLKPADWLATDIKSYDESYELGRLHSLFANRVKFSNFTLSYLDRLATALNAATKNNDDVQLKLEFAITLIQNRPNLKQLQDAYDLLQEIVVRKDVSETIASRAYKIQQVVSDMLCATQQRSTITCVNWGIYNRCPLVCKGCYNIFNSNILSFAECISIVDKLSDAGVKELIISGGDPLLWEHILQFCSYASQKGLMIGIDTVGYNLSIEILAELQDKISYIGIPIDGADQKTIEGFRIGKKDLFQVLQSNLALLDQYHIPVRINTTVSRVNLNTLQAIAQLLKQHSAVKSWALYQWWDIRASRLQVKSMSISELEFLNSTSTLSEIINIPMAFKTVRRRALGTFFIASNGEVYTFPELADISTIIIGDIKIQSIAEIISCPALRKDSIKFSGKTFV